ncbi:MAG: structural protein [Desulfovibrio sp.]|jgi:hypothetical protein|nr:structural protein [Desulfovibrio sp.]
MSIPRGIRNNNPGNIRHGDKWQGLSPDQPDSAFCSFTTAEYGIRALGKVLLNYQAKHNLNTVRGLISRWAPPNENNTTAYVAGVARFLGVDPDAKITVAEHLLPLTRAIIQHENGQQPYSDDVIAKGVGMALGA